MAYESVKNQIDAYIKANGVNLITGPVLNAVLTTMLDELGEGYAFQGVLDTTDTPSPAADIPQAWLASAGTYLGGSITVDEGELALIIHIADSWSKETVYRGVQLSHDAIVAAIGYTPADDADLAEKQDAIPDLSAIRSGAALGSSSVQPADIENMVEAEPIGSIVPPVNPSEFATKEELSQLSQEVDELENATEGVSSSLDFNAIVKELYLNGVTISDIGGVRLSKSTTGISFVFLNANRSPIITFTTEGNRISYAINESSIFVALIVPEEITLGNTDFVLTLNSNRVGDLSYSPVIENFLTNKNKRGVLPSFTRTTSARISTSGAIVSAGSSWFYTSPILLKAGEALFLQSNGNANAIPLAVTDENGSFYRAVTVYGGSDPGKYYYYAEKDTYVAISGYNNTKFFLSIYKDDYANAIVTKLQSEITKCESDIEELKTGGGPSISLQSVNYAFREPKIISGADVSDVTKWGVDNGATLATGRKYNNITRMDRAVMTITSEANNGAAWCNIATPVNANLYALLVEFCINYEGNNVPGVVAIELFSGQTRDSNHKKSIQFQFYGNDGYKRNGWHQACFFFPSAKLFFADGASFDPTAVTAVGLRLYNSDNIAYSVSVARMDFVPSMKKPGIVTIVDNFGVSVPAMADYAHSKGVRLNLSIIPGAYTGASGAPTCATKAELDRVALQGHCIWNHTYTHQALNDLTFAQIQDQINLAEQWMEENGYGKNCDFLSIPSASFNTESSDAVFESNVRTIFHNWCYNHQMVYVPYGPVMRTLPVTILDSTAKGEGKTPADIASVAAKCITYNGLAVIGFHGTYWELDNGDSWKAYIDAIAELGVYHYGIDELVAGRWC